MASAKVVESGAVSTIPDSEIEDDPTPMEARLIATPSLVPWRS